jgi:hypothetical protein
VGEDDAGLGVVYDVLKQRDRVGQLKGKEGAPCLQGRQARDHVLDAVLHVDAHELVGPNPHAPEISREVFGSPIELLIGQRALRIYDGRRIRCPPRLLLEQLVQE